MSEEKAYSWITPLKKAPVITKAPKKTIAHLIVEEFQSSGLKYAEIDFAKAKDKYSSVAFLARAIGRVLGKTDLKDKVSVSSNTDKNVVYLVRT